MNNYVQRVCLTIWRKKTSILFLSGSFVLVIYGLRYARVEKVPGGAGGVDPAEEQAEMVAEALLKTVNVRFLENRSSPDSNRISESSDEVSLGVPYVGLDPKRPYVPKRRLVHLDLKGAPPLLGYLRKFLGMIKTMGATGILLEYEDTFPFRPPLGNVSARNAYRAEEVRELISSAHGAGLEVIPLVQTFGHLEFLLKNEEFAHIREVAGSPQSLCPSRVASLEVVREMVNQVLSMHPQARHLHIGCDEVFQMGECELCRLEAREALFLRHVKAVAQIVKVIRPEVKVIVWDDMFRHISTDVLIESKIGSLVEPMVWVYAEDIYHFVQPAVWEKYSLVFETAWTASAFKGAFGETLYVPNARRHLENNLRWLEVMSTQTTSFRRGIAGIAVTGWQRYDHFAVLCELLPASIPSLSLSLAALRNGYFNSSLRTEVLTGLSCPDQNAGPFVTLDSDPFLWEKIGKCMFPGNAIFRLTPRLHNVEIETEAYLRSITRERAWLTPYNVRHNYSLRLRVDELIVDLPRAYHSLVSLARATHESMRDVFDNYTINEWIEQRVYPMAIELERLQNDSSKLKGVERWQRRPLRGDGDGMRRLGIGVEVTETLN